MKIDTLTRILDGIAGVRKDGAVSLVPDDTEVALYIGLTAEVLTLPRVSKISATADLLTIETHKGERFYFSPEDLAGVKVGGIERASAKGAGFR